MAAFPDPAMLNWLQTQATSNIFNMGLNAGRVNQTLPWGTQSWAYTPPTGQTASTTQQPAQTAPTQTAVPAWASYINNPQSLPISAVDQVAAQDLAAYSGQNPANLVSAPQAQPQTGQNTQQAAVQPGQGGTWDYTYALDPRLQGLFNQDLARQGQFSGLLSQAGTNIGNALRDPMDFSTIPNVQTNLGPNYQTGVNLQTNLGPGYRTNLQSAPMGEAYQTGLQAQLSDFQFNPELSTTELNPQQAGTFAPTIGLNQSDFEVYRPNFTPVSIGGSAATLIGNRGQEVIDKMGGYETLLKEMDPYAYNQEAADALYRQQERYLTPQQQQLQSALEARLAEQGFVPGVTPGYSTEMGNFRMDQERAYADARDRAITLGVDAGSQAFGNRLGALQTGANAALSGYDYNLSEEKAKQEVANLNARLALEGSIASANQQIAIENMRRNAALDANDVAQQIFGNQQGVYNTNLAGITANNTANLGAANFGLDQTTANNTALLSQANFGLGQNAQNFGMLQAVDSAERQGVLDRNDVNQDYFDNQLAAAGFNNTALINQGAFQNDALLDQANFGNTALINQMNTQNQSIPLALARMLVERTAPMEEYQTLLGLGQQGLFNVGQYPQNPTTAPVPNVPVPDVTSPYLDQYSAQLSADNARRSSTSGLLGALIGGAATIF